MSRRDTVARATGWKRGRDPDVLGGEVAGLRDALEVGRAQTAGGAGVAGGVAGAWPSGRALAQHVAAGFILSTT